MIYLLLLVFIGIAVALAWFLIAHDHGEDEPVAALWLAVGFGFLGAVLASVIEKYTVHAEHLQPLAPLPQITFAALSIGIIEEACKFLPLAFFIYKKRYFNEHTDGVIYFALAGLGFGLPENILYTLQFGTETGIGRIILTPFFHAAITAFVGYALIKRKMLGRRAIGVAIPLGIAMLTHGLYDLGMSSGRPLFAVISVLITLGLSAGLFVLFVHANETDQDRGLSVVGHNAFCRSCGKPNKRRQLYCTACGKNA